MQKIYSKQNPDKLLHMIVRKSDMMPVRIDLIPEQHFIQCSTLNLEKNKTFQPHKHILKLRQQDIIYQ